jgi:ABC-type multidrug transport system ATPase subunit
MTDGEVRLEDVAMTFPGGRRVLDGAEAVVEAGQALALLGRNGAGKTTLLRLLAALALPTRGRVLVNGRCTAGARRDVVADVGVSLYPERSFHFRLTVEQNLRYFQALDGRVGRSAAAERAAMLELVGLGGHASQPFMALSLGQRSRLGLARALCGDPAVLLLDEPFANLDEQGRAMVADVVRARRARTRTTIFTTHDLGDVRHAVSHVGTLAGGALCVAPVASSPDGVTSRRVRVHASRRARADLTRLLSQWSGTVDGGVLEVAVPVEVSLSEVVAEVERAGFAVERVDDEPWAEVHA